MVAHRNLRIVLAHIREAGAGAKIDDDNDIIVQSDGHTVVVSVNEHYVHARMFFNTAAPVNALAIVSRRLNQRLLCGRLGFPDEGGVFIVDYSHRYNNAPTAFDSVSPVGIVIEVAGAVADIARELGYNL